MQNNELALGFVYAPLYKDNKKAFPHDVALYEEEFESQDALKGWLCGVYGNDGKPAFEKENIRVLVGTQIGEDMKKELGWPEVFVVISDKDGDKKYPNFEKPGDDLFVLGYAHFKNLILQKKEQTINFVSYNK